MLIQRISRLVASASSLGLTIAGALAFLAPLATRLMMGQAFYLTGHGKLANFDRTAAFFTDLGIPFPVLNAGLVSTLELVGGICLILGLGSRIFSVLLSGSMVVALLTADKQTFLDKFPADITDVVPFVYLMFLAWIALYGPGPVSLDRLLSKALNRTATLEARRLEPART
jgi:putative oxidoreductase